MYITSSIARVNEKGYFSLENRKLGKMSSTKSLYPTKGK